MKVFSRLEEISEKFIEGIFKGKNASLQPIEIAKKLAKKMEQEQKVSVSKIYVPNLYQVKLNPIDQEKISSLKQSFSDELINYLRTRAEAQDLFFSGSLEVTLVDSEELKPGQFKIESGFSERPELTPEQQDNTQIFNNSFNINSIKQERAEVIVIKGQDEGMTFRLANFPLYLGRKRSNQIYIDDLNVSRKHALIENVNGDYYLSDLDSLNGTFVNGEEIIRKKIENGDLLKVGTTLLRFKVVTE